MLQYALYRYEPVDVSPKDGAKTVSLPLVFDKKLAGPSLRDAINIAAKAICGPDARVVSAYPAGHLDVVYWDSKEVS